ncbi:dihydrofolate reductase family protein [Candidatus Falkowbacteria bacterium]|nr:dihydrofolate reductase family protein [Candidatus Falkowbacteria bacterium]
MKLIVMMAITADGIIAKTKDQKADWTSSADKKAFIAETKKHGVIIMGDTTFNTIGRPLPGRLNLILSLTPERYKEREQPDILEFKKGTPEEIIKMLEDRGFESAILGGGARTNSFFLKAGLVDEILLTVEPKIFGIGLNFTEGEDLDLNLELISAKEIGDNAVQLHYKVLK